jgi:hypothetical protein
MFETIAAKCSVTPTFLNQTYPHEMNMENDFRYLMKLDSYIQTVRKVESK